MAEPTDPSALGSLRRLLYGDLGIDEWPAGDVDPSGAPWPGPWSSFVEARAHLANGDQDLAMRAWSQVANPIFGFESRHVLQAWHLLRSVGIVPDASIAEEVLGIVAEVAIDGGHDVLAAYVDGSVRFLHHLGAASIFEPPAPAPVAQAAAAWLGVAGSLVREVAPWSGDGGQPAGSGETRFALLTRAGHRSLVGDDASMAASPVASQLLGAGAVLLQAVTAV